MYESQPSKVTRRHLDRQAVLYVRQSTLRQVQRNTESTQRQYALRARAVALGWPDDRIRVLDEDLGKSGTSSENRDGFRQLVASVAVGEVGIVMGLEVSRLARNNADWHRLLELASQARTLILDETGVYDPHEFNDRILLGLKGQFSEIELFGLVSRLHGGIRNKARRGALKTRLPVGLVYRQDDTVALDPDHAVVAAIGCVFDTFQRLESATATWHWLEEEGVQLPGEVRHGARRGQRIWLSPSLSRVLGFIKNPRYAGAFAWGRRDAATVAAAQGSRALENRWQVLLPNFHAGYLDWERFVANQTILARNEGAFRHRLPTPRQGCALLQSRVLCGHCGGRMQVHYVRSRNRDDSPGKTYPYYVCRTKRSPSSARVCQSLSARPVDAEVARQIVAAVHDDNIAVALAVQEEVRLYAAQAAAARQQRLKRLQFEADLAAQRYYAVNPLNRTVADQLESDWNTHLRALEEARHEHERLVRADRSLLSDDARRRIEGVALDFSRIWDAPQTQPVDRKRILATIIEDVTLVRSSYRCRVQIRFHGGATREVTVPLPCGAARLGSVQPDVVELVERLAVERTPEAIAAELNRQGYTAWQGLPYTAAAVRRIRRVNRLQPRTGELRARGLRTAREVAAMLGVSQVTVRNWGQRGLLRRETIMAGLHQTRALYALPDDTTVARMLNEKRNPKAPDSVPDPNEHVGSTE